MNSSLGVGSLLSETVEGKEPSPARCRSSMPKDPSPQSRRGACTSPPRPASG